MEFPPWAQNFDDFMHVPDRVLALALFKVDSAVLVLALKTASPDLRDRVFSFFNENVSKMIQEQMEFIGPVRLADIAKAQKVMVEMVNSTP